jgi:sulfatase maturation enzyme AslB (radical SAM superfamily)
MDLQATTQMLTSRNIKVLHLEPTDVCQAECPLCARETDHNFNKKARHQLSVDVLEHLLPEEFVANLDKMFMCGNYGDPAAGNHTIAIYEWFRQKNPNIVLGMNTNGAIGTTFWWHSLAKIMNQPLDYVVFSIDGLEDTNSDYRVNVNWTKLMQNAQAFIAGGGSAHWDMLVYRHNQHQVDACEKLARDMGFRWFRAKVSKRPAVGKLESPIGWQIPNVQAKVIDCHALKEQSIYIDAQGRVSPCCWLGSRQRNFVTDFEEVKNSWISLQPNIICADTCGTSEGNTSFANQWQREVCFV